jgi:hypothetical protein
LRGKQGNPIGLDTPLIVTNGLVLIKNCLVCNNTSEEYFIYEEKYFVFLDLIWLSFLPFIVMLIMNIFARDRNNPAFVCLDGVDVVDRKLSTI